MTVRPRPEGNSATAEAKISPVEAKTSHAHAEKGPKEESTSGGRRRGRKTSSSRAAKATGVARYFLTKPAKDGAPELDRELTDENQAIIEALKQDRTFVAVTEWRPKVDCSVQGRPAIEKEAVFRGSQ
jgi:hypothetical protein